MTLARTQWLYRAGALVWVSVFSGLLFTGCDTANQSSTTETRLQACEREPGDSPPAVSGAECGRFSVPLDHARADSEHIDIAVKRWPSISAVPEPDPIFIIAGGPGQSAIEVSDTLVQAFFNLRKERDIVFVDQRGTGQSAPLYCLEEQPVSLAEPMLASHAKVLESLRQCASEHASKAPFMTTPYAVADLEFVREALGYSRINLWAGSYGTRVALAYMGAHPSVIRSAVLDGLAPVSLALPKTMGASANRALAEVAQQCTSEPACASRYGDPADNARRVAERLAQAPVRMTIDDPLTSEPREILLDAEKFASLVRLTLYDRILSRLLPHLLARAEAGDFSLLASAVSQFMAADNQPRIAMGMHFSVICSEDMRAAPALEPASFLGVDLADTMIQVCEFWPSGELPDHYFTPVAADAPTLLLSGERDPVTPPEWGERVAEHLSQATHLVASGAHHGVTVQGCASKLLTEFVRHTTLEASQAECIDTIIPMQPYLQAQPAQSTEASE
ncbi:alpha/beta hydrolase [Gilvimarinus algae]|uniref:Alpha/beta hydrolase n=1 Tax=Gilvimarinus algae TaxID=3058037 RepID=A0ABT8TI98_9GAMM|nr:alpha/beta hydrolase [Gilvimarinus sp. SDUM040014]MDO3383812.1 alpha/beta hydrolase [Gilvimarinus sp. SDUM040014]